MQKKGTDVSINAIPSEADAVIVVPAAQAEQAKEQVAAEEASQKAVYGTVETNLSMTAEGTERPEQVWSQADTDHLVDLLVLLQQKLGMFDGRHDRRVFRLLGMLFRSIFSGLFRIRHAPQCIEVPIHAAASKSVTTPCM